jgi:predicted deacylase
MNPPGSPPAPREIVVSHLRRGRHLPPLKPRLRPLVRGLILLALPSCAFTTLAESPDPGADAAAVEADAAESRDVTLLLQAAETEAAQSAAAEATQEPEPAESADAGEAEQTIHAEAMAEAEASVDVDAIADDDTNPAGEIDAQALEEQAAAQMPEPGTLEYDILRAVEAANEERSGDVTLPVTIGGVTVQPGSRREFRLQTTEDFTAGNVEAWGMVVHGAKPGPVLCLIGGIHGDELNGVEIVRRVIETESPAALSGTLVGVPIVNISGFSNQTRYLPDRRDLNRYFPGRANGSIASRVAWELWSKVIVHCTHLIDLHTGSHNRTNLPQIRGDLNNPIVLDMARAFDARVAIHNPGLDGTLRSAASRAGIAAVLYEAGETLRFQEDEIQMGVTGVRNVMRSLSMRRARQVSRGPQYMFRETRWLRADRGGILDLRVKPGDTVAVNDVVGVISDPLRRTRHNLISRRKGRVIGIALLPMVSPGMAVVHLGIPGSNLATAELDDELDKERPE